MLLVLLGPLETDTNQEYITAQIGTHQELLMGNIIGIGQPTAKFMV